MPSGNVGKGLHRRKEKLYEQTSVGKVSFNLLRILKKVFTKHIYLLQVYRLKLP